MSDYCPAARQIRKVVACAKALLLTKHTDTLDYHFNEGSAFVWWLLAVALGHVFNKRPHYYSRPHYHRNGLQWACLFGLISFYYRHGLK